MKEQHFLWLAISCGIACNASPQQGGGGFSDRSGGHGGFALSSGGSASNGGFASSGGAPSSGGVIASGGAFGSGGVVAAGGSVASGGATGGVGGTGPGGNRDGAAGGSTDATDGASASGGRIGSGGSAAISGGTTGNGGAAATGGVASTGGVPSTTGVLVNGIQWADTSGKPIQAHGGGVIKVGSYYYWFGENRNPDSTFLAVSCYRSTDLVHWEFRHDVLTQNSAAELKRANIERPKVIYNKETNKYVMWMHWENGVDYGQARAAVASSDTVDGDYSYAGSFRPLAKSGVTDHNLPGYMSRDCTLFVDADDKAYFLSASNENYDLNLYRLSADYLAVDSLVAILFKGGHREAPALWKRGNIYFLLTSAATGWNPNQAQYATSMSLGSGWSNMTNVGDATTFYSQSAYVLPVTGSAGTSFLYMGDRWAGAWSGPVNDSMYIFLPITFPSSTSMSMGWNNTVTFDTTAGTISGSTTSFPFLNKAGGKAMAVQGASMADHGTVVQTGYTGGNEQKWNLNYDGSGYFYITNVNSSKVLDVVSSSTADGAAIDQWTNTGGDNQRWRIVDKGGGYVQLLNKHSGKVVEAPAGATDDVALDQRAASTANNQLWRMTVENRSIRGGPIPARR